MRDERETRGTEGKLSRWDGIGGEPPVVGLIKSDKGWYVEYVGDETVHIRIALMGLSQERYESRYWKKCVC